MQRLVRMAPFVLPRSRIWRECLWIMTKATLVLLQVLFATPGFSQSKYLSGDFWIENYGKKEGLPESVVVDAMQDKKGYLWVATPYSLVRFDGYQFKAFQPREQYPSLYIHFRNGMLQDESGKLWLPTLNNGLFRFDPETRKFDHFDLGQKPNLEAGSSVTSIVDDQYGHLWIGTPYGVFLLSKTDSKVQIRGPAIFYPDPILHALDRVIDDDSAFAGFSKVGNNQNKETTIAFHRPTRMLVVYMGEAGNGDDGWIENDDGKVVWKAEDCYYAGGADKNILKLEVARFKPGKYKLRYKSDDSHAWNTWNAAPPDRAKLWGIQLFNLPNELLDSFQHSLAELKSVHYSGGRSIYEIEKDSQNAIWIMSNAGLERLFPSADIDS